MSFVLGGSKSSQSSKSTGTYDKNSSSSTRAVAPSWIEDAYKSLTDRVIKLGNADPSGYVPGKDPMHAAAEATGGMLSGQPWNWEAAMDITKGVSTANAPQTSGARAVNYMDDYTNRHLKDVIDASIADYDYQSGLEKAQLDLDLNREGAFGGSGVAIQKDLAADSMRRGRNSIRSNLLSEGFNTALAAGQADANRAQEARNLNAQLYGQQMDRALGGAGQLASLASGMEGNLRANAATQLDLGEVLRRISGEQAQAPLTLAQWTGDSLPDMLSRFFGEDTTGKESGTEQSKTKGKGSTLGFSVSGGSGK